MNWHRLRACGLLVGTIALPACGSAPDEARAPVDTDAPDAAVAITDRAPATPPHHGVARTVPPHPAEEGTPGATPSALTAAASPNTVTYKGGAVLANVHVVPVFWGAGVNATIQREIHCYYNAVVRSPYMDWLSEYNTPTQTIGRGTVGSDVTITPVHTGTTLSDGDIQAEIATQIDRKVLPAPDENTIFMIYFPPSVGISANGGSCAPKGFCAYHDAFIRTQTSPNVAQLVRYGVFPDLSTGGCATSCGGGTFFENVGYASSHELAEAITDPDFNGGWGGAKGEIGDDICNQQEVTLPGTNYTVQSLWSNAHGACYSPTSGSAVTEPPVIDSISPATGPADRSSTFTINGSCFAGPFVSVTKGVGTINPTPTAATPTQITVTIPGSPDDGVGAANVSVSNTGSTGPTPAHSTFTFVPSSTVFLSPVSGPMQGDVPVTLHGGPFRTGAGTLRAYFDGVVNPQPAQCESTTTCVVYPPPHDPGTVSVTLSVDGVTETVSNKFTYFGPQITSVTPASGPISGGTSVNVHVTGALDTSMSSVIVPGTLGGQSIGTVACSREGCHDASCEFNLPARASVPAAPLDLQLTFTHTTGTKIPTAIVAADRFTYTQLPALTSLGFLASASGGQTASASLSLSGYAPSGGAQISLALAAGAPANVVQFPSTVVIPAGQSSVSIPVLVTNQNYTGDVSIVASYAGTLVSGALRVYPTSHPTLSPILPLCAARTFVETIKLAEPAPPGGGVVLLSVDNAAARVPASITVPAGSSSATFQVTAASPATAQTVHLNASYYGIPSSPVTFSVLPASGINVSLVSSVQGGLWADGTLDLCSAAPAGGAIVSLSSDSALAVPPASVTVPAGATSTSLSIPTRRTSTAESALITATYQGNTSTAHLGIAASTVIPVTCPTNQTLCTCSSGTHTCVTSSTQCLLFCSKH